MGIRAFALLLSVSAASVACVLFFKYAAADGLDRIDILRSILILISTWWLAWGAVQAVLGLFTRPPRVTYPQTPLTATTAVLVPVYNEDPMITFARIAVMDASLRATGLADQFHFAVLSDTRKDEVAVQERQWFARLLRDCGGEGRMFYRRRPDNIGKKAGNIEDFIQRSGAAYDFALILDADSLIEGETIVEMARRMQAVPDLGLLQTLPKVVGAQSFFGRAMQFSAAFHSPIFARGLAMMQGRTGPFWGHNAMVRVRAFAESCGLPQLRGEPPFGGHILSHDYVEAALLARAGWQVRLDDDLDGSYEEGPQNIVDHAKRDRRWCQGNLQHSRLLGAPRLYPWSRFIFLQGIFAYIAPLFWMGFIIASIIAPVFAPGPDYFPEPYWPFPVFTGDATSKAISLAIGVFGLLILPKILIAMDAAASGRARGFGGAILAFVSTIAEFVFSSITAPIFLMFQTRSVLQVLLGRDGGWPANNRGDGQLSRAEAWAASSWIVLTGVLGLWITNWLAPDLLLWLLPVALPMIAAPWILQLSSLKSHSALFRTPAERVKPPILTMHDAVLAKWAGPTAQSAPTESGALHA